MITIDSPCLNSDSPYDDHYELSSRRTPLTLPKTITIIFPQDEHINSHKGDRH